MRATVDMQKIGGLKGDFLAINKDALSLETNRTTKGGHENDVGTRGGDFTTPRGGLGGVACGVPGAAIRAIAREVLFLRSLGADDGKLLKAGALAAVPAEVKSAGLSEQAAYAIDDDKASRANQHATICSVARVSAMGSAESTRLW